MAVATDALLVAKAFDEGGAQRPPHVLHRVVAVDVQVARALDRQVYQRVAGQQRQHVVEEAQARLDPGHACPVDVERQANVGLGGFSGDGGGAGHGGSSSGKVRGQIVFRQARNASISSSVPTVTRRPSPQPA